MKEPIERSHHVLNASSNLLGICFILLTSLKLLDKSGTTIIDEITLVAIILFMTSTILSYLSIREKKGSGEVLEKTADYCFIGGISLLFFTTLLFSFNI